MGRIFTVYLSDEESLQLKSFCDENQCTQYSALKTAVKELLSKPIKSIVEEQVGNHTEKSEEKELENEKIA